MLFMMTATSSTPGLAPQVFVVDDEEILLELAESVLLERGLKVQTFADPVAALLSFRDAKVRPRILVTDFAMDSMTGLELVEQCRKIDPKLEVILVSGTVDETATRGVNPPIKYFFRKPYDPPQLGKLVWTLLGAEAEKPV